MAESDIQVAEPCGRFFKIACNADFLDEQTILNGADHKSIKGFAYILHDKDVVVQDDIDDPKNSYQQEDLGTRKAPHWHINVETAKSWPVSTIAKWFNIPKHLVRVMNGAGAFKDYLAYLTHISPKAQEQNKTYYDPEEVKGLRFPDKAWCRTFETYYDFADYYEQGLLRKLDSYETAVASGKMTPDDIRECNLEYYVKHMDDLKRLRKDYIAHLPTPENRQNYYISGDGGIGKGIVAQLLARNLLSLLHPDVNFDEVDIYKHGNPYVFYAGTGTAAFNDYEGQEIIIFEECRARELRAMFRGDTGAMFMFLDTHPKPVRIHTKGGVTCPVNRFNIVMSPDPFDKFKRELGYYFEQILDDDGKIVGVQRKDEEPTQIERRFPYFITLNDESIGIGVKTQYFFGSKIRDFYDEYSNDAIKAIRAGVLGLQESVPMFQPLIDVTKDVIEVEAQVVDDFEPGTLFEKLTPEVKAQRAEKKAWEQAQEEADQENIFKFELFTMYQEYLNEYTVALGTTKIPEDTKPLPFLVWRKVVADSNSLGACYRPQAMYKVCNNLGEIETVYLVELDGDVCYFNADGITWKSVYDSEGKPDWNCIDENGEEHKACKYKELCSPCDEMWRIEDEQLKAFVINRYSQYPKVN